MRAGTAEFRHAGRAGRSAVGPRPSGRPEKTYGRLDILCNIAGISGRDPQDETSRPALTAGPRLADQNARAVEPSHGDQCHRRFSWEPRPSVPGHAARPAAARSSTSPRSAASSAHMPTPPIMPRKGAVRIFSKAAAIQYAPDKIRVNSVHPGFCRHADDRCRGHSNPEVARKASGSNAAGPLSEHPPTSPPAASTLRRTTLRGSPAASS